MSSLGALFAVAALVLVALAALIAVDKRRPLRALDDQPESLVAGTPLEGGDLDHHVNLRIAADSRLHRRTSR